MGEQGQNAQDTALAVALFEAEMEQVQQEACISPMVVSPAKPGSPMVMVGYTQENLESCELLLLVCPAIDGKVDTMHQSHAHAHAPALQGAHLVTSARPHSKRLPHTAGPVVAAAAAAACVIAPPAATSRAVQQVGNVSSSAVLAAGAAVGGGMPDDAATSGPFEPECLGKCTVVVFNMQKVQLAPSGSSSSSSSSTALGTLVLQLLCCIGRGGTADVYRAKVLSFKPNADVAAFPTGWGTKAEAHPQEVAVKLARQPQPRMSEEEWAPYLSHKSASLWHELTVMQELSYSHLAVQGYLFWHSLCCRQQQPWLHPPARAVPADGVCGAGVPHRQGVASRPQRHQQALDGQPNLDGYCHLAVRTGGAARPSVHQPRPQAPQRPHPARRQ